MHNAVQIFCTRAWLGKLKRLFNVVFVQPWWRDPPSRHGEAATASRCGSAPFIPSLRFSRPDIDSLDIESPWFQLSGSIHFQALKGGG